MFDVRRLFGLLSLVTLALVWLLAVGPTRFGGPAGYVIVSGKSMEPTLLTGDLVITRTQSSYSPGDVVAFRVPADDEQAAGSLIIHRIAGGDGERGYIMQGDNKPAPDTWQPRQSDIVGKQWLHLPGFGKHLGQLQQPSYFVALVAGISTLSLFGGARAKRTRRRKHMKANHQTMEGQSLHGASLSLVLLGLTVGLTAAVGVLAFIAFSSPTKETAATPVVSYEHTSAFSYSVDVSPSTLYPSGRLGPFVDKGTPGQQDVAAAPAPGSVFFSRLTHGMDIGFDYALSSPATANLRGEMSIQLEIKATGTPGWTKMETLLEPIPFQGSKAGTNIYLDLEPVKHLIEAIETETGHKAQAYEIRVQPLVHVFGTLGSEPVDDVYAPVLITRYNTTAFSPDTALRMVEPKNVTAPSLLANKIDFGILTLPVTAARWVGGISIVLFSLSLVAMAVTVLRGLLSDEWARLRARYGTRIVPVTTVDRRGSHRVDVASLEDLAILAARDGKIIFNQKVPDGDLFFVPDGPLTYQYAKGKNGS